MDAATLLNIFLGVLALVSLLGAATSVLFSTRTKATIDGLRGDVSDYVIRLGRVEGTVRTLTAENVALHEKNVTLHSENETLRSMKDATAAVGRLADAVGVSDRVRQEEHHDILATIQAGHSEVLRLIDATVHTHSGGVV